MCKVHIFLKSSVFLLFELCMVFVAKIYDSDFLFLFFTWIYIKTTFGPYDHFKPPLVEKMIAHMDRFSSSISCIGPHTAENLIMAAPIIHSPTGSGSSPGTNGILAAWQRSSTKPWSSFGKRFNRCVFNGLFSCGVHRKTGIAVCDERFILEQSCRLWDSVLYSTIPYHTILHFTFRNKHSHGFAMIPCPRPRDNQAT